MRKLDTTHCTKQQRPRVEPLLTRRAILVRGGAGFGALALSALTDAIGVDAATNRQIAAEFPLMPKPTHMRARARSIIFLFMEGAPSHLDLFDRKPLLNELDDQPLPPSFKGHLQAMSATEAGSRVMGSPRKWRQYGSGGVWVSDWLPHTAKVVDELAVIRSCWTDGVNHAGGVCQMNTGTPMGGRPSLGSWVTYGLGTENQNLPAFVVLTDSGQRIANGSRNWSPGFMPALYQGTKFSSVGAPIANLATPSGVDRARQRAKLALLNQLNTEHANVRRDQTELEARIRSYELAFRMQAEAPEAVDLSNETAETLRLYGIDQKQTAQVGKLCLLARRLVERGVRFVQLYHGCGSRWDSHDNIERDHPPLCREQDLPVAGLIRDLRRRGLLDETLVLWGGEFGRTPIRETNTGREGLGRDHNPTGFTMWLAGGGVRGGHVYGATDELGLHAVEDRLHVLDLHATILRAMGIDHKRLTYLHQGRPERPTINSGHVYTKLFA